MATPTAAQRAQIVELYVAYFNRAPEATGLEFWAQKFADLTELEAGNAAAALNTVANGMWDAAEGEVGYDEATDTSAFLDLVYQNVLGRTADATGKAFWAGKLDAGEVSRGEFILQFIGGITEAGDPAGYERFNARNDVAEVWSQDEFSAGLTDAEARAQGAAVIAGIDTEAQAQAKIADLIGSLPGNTILLTTGQDNLVGTSGNDTFKAYIFDNKNTLQSGDMIDGAGGTNNKLIADLGSSSNFAITPHTVRVQTIELRAQSKAYDSGDNNTVAGAGGLPVDSAADARIDAERSINVKEWINNNSRADLVIEDIRLDDINSNRESGVAAVTKVTKDVTLTLRNTDAGAVDFRVYFEANSLKAVPSTREGAQLNIELMDTRAAIAGEPPLLNSPFDGFTFTLDGAAIRVQSDAIGNATTYAELLAAVQTAVAAIPALRDFTVAISGKFTATDTLTGIQATGDVITLTNNGAGVVGAGNYLTPDGSVPGSSGLHLEQDTSAPLVTDNLVTSKIILDNVGRGEVSDAYAPGSAAGDFVVGSMATRGGVERFEVEVQRGSWINSLSSTNNTLQEVQFVNGTSPEGQNTTAPGYVHIGASREANSAYGNLTGWQNGSRALATNGLTDVRLIEATQFDGNIKIGAQITRAVFDKYLNAIDPDTGVANAEDVQFDYNLGKGNDNLNVSIDKFVTADVDFKLNINGGAGNNIISVRLVEGDVAKTNATNGNWLTNQANLDNLSITVGDGNNTIYTFGRGDYDITTGRGNDTVYVDNTGDKAVFILRAASNAPADRAVYVSEAAGVLPLNNDIAGATPQSYVGAYAKVTVNFRDLVSTAYIDFNATTGAFSDLDVNQAIKLAINRDPVLSKLLVAKDGAGHSLIIESLIDGETLITDLTVAFAQRTVAEGLPAVPSPTLPLFNGAVVGSVTPTTAAALNTAFEPDYAVEGAANPVVTGAVSIFQQGDPITQEVQTITFTPVELTAMTVGTSYELEYNGETFVVTLVGPGLVGLQTALDTALATAIVPATVTMGATNVNIISTANGAIPDTTTLNQLNLGNELEGSNSTSHSDNVITITGGEDVIVLGTNLIDNVAGSTAGSNDTVKFAASASNVDVTIVDFVAGPLLTTGLDVLDLRALNGQGGASFNGGYVATVTDKSISLIGFDALNPATGVTFAGLNAVQLLAELNAAVGGIDSASGTTLTQHVFLIADVDGGILNDNVFKVFTAESAAGSTDFTSVTLVGVVDLADTDLGTLTGANFAVDSLI